MIIRYLAYAIRWHSWPSPVQRELMRGDPDGRVRTLADRILAEMQEEDRKEES
jgi:hypothetical protein